MMIYEDASRFSQGELRTALSSLVNQVLERLQCLKVVVSMQQRDVFKWSTIAIPKVSCFAWRAVLNKILTLDAFGYRGLSIGNWSCSSCSLHHEMIAYILAKCVFAKFVWWQICVWVKTPIPTLKSLQDLLMMVWSLDTQNIRTKLSYAIFLMAALAEEK